MFVDHLDLQIGVLTEKDGFILLQIHSVVCINISKHDGNGF
jgi:hypothetical protein